MANDIPIAATEKKAIVIARANWILRRAFERIAPDPPDQGRPLLHLDTCELPDRAAIELLILKLRITVVRIDDEERPLVTHRHVLTVTLECEDDFVLRHVLHR